MKILLAITTIGAAGLLSASVAAAEDLSALFPVRIGAYAPLAGGCDAPAAAMIYVESKGLAANKTAGLVRTISRKDENYVLEVLWVEVGAEEKEGDPDRVTIVVQDDRHFWFTNSESERTLMAWCN